MKTVRKCMEALFKDVSYTPCDRRRLFDNCFKHGLFICRHIIIDKTIELRRRLNGDEWMVFYSGTALKTCGDTREWIIEGEGEVYRIPSKMWHSIEPKKTLRGFQFIPISGTFSEKEYEYYSQWLSLVDEYIRKVVDIQDAYLIDEMKNGLSKFPTISEMERQLAPHAQPINYL